MSNVRIELFFSTVAEAAAFLAGRDTPALVTEQPKAEEPPKATRRSGVKPAETPAATPAASPASEQPSPESSAKETKPETPPAEEKPADTTPQLSYAEDIQKPVMALVATGKQDKLQEILKDLGLASFKGSDPTIWPAAKAKLDAALAAAKAEAELA